MSEDFLTTLLFAGGVGHFGVLVASALVPLRLDWRKELACLSRLHRQMYWVYGGYVVLSIVAFGLITLFNARALAGGSDLARAVFGPRSPFVAGGSRRPPPGSDGGDDEDRRCDAGPR